MQWRHRDPIRFAAEIARLCRDHGVTLVKLADENPTSSRNAWTAFLHAMIAEDVPVTIIGLTRADDIERPKDRQAIDPLRANGIIGLCTFAVGFAEEADCDYGRLLRTQLAHDPDQVMSVYATPHAWTPFHAANAGRRVVRDDLRLWDDTHQVLEVLAVPHSRVFRWVKLIEAALQLRPRAVAQLAAPRPRHPPRDALVHPHGPGRLAAGMGRAPAPSRRRRADRR